MRLKHNYNIAKKCSGDIITVLPGNEKDGTEDIRIRVIEVILSDGTKEYLATNLFDSHISQQMFRELYFYRWPVETKYKNFPVQRPLQCFKNFISTYFFQTCHLLLKIKLMKKFRLPLKIQINIDTKQTEHLLSDVSKQ